MASKSTKKSKKPLQTTLGRAVPTSGEKVDVSHVGKPIHTSIFGLSQLLSLPQTGTQEVLNYIDNECDLIYECRVCRTLFRSIANFILHKREYCREQFTTTSKYPRSFEQGSTIFRVFDENSNTKPNLQKTSAYVLPSENSGNTLASVINKLKEKHHIQEFSKKVIEEDLSDAKEKSPNLSTDNNVNDLLVEQIATNNVAVFQTLVKSFSERDNIKEDNIKSQVMEIHTILGKDEGVLGPDGKIFSLQATDKTATTCKTDLICPECNLKFSTKKTLTYHIKYKHNKTRLVFICPDCKGHFANAWSVYRHLYKVHRRTAGYIKRMRDQINTSVVSKEVLPTKKKEKAGSENVEPTDEENQWLNNIEEDKDFQMCGGCGKRFERKAALHSHAQMCIKRIAVCNSIKENSAKRKEEEIKDKTKVVKVDKICSSEISEVPKGASKRKPYLLRTYKKREDAFPLRTQENTSVICDVNANSKIVDINCDISSKVITDSSFIKNEAISLDSVESKSADANLNTSDNLENFKGFSRDQEEDGELLKIKSEEDEEVELIRDVYWENLRDICVLPTSKSVINEGNDKISDSAVTSNFVEIDNGDKKGSSSTPLKKCKERSVDFSISSPLRSARISIRSLGDLTGISPIRNKQKSTLSSIEDDVSTPNHIEMMKDFDRRHKIIDGDNYISDSIKANVSPKMLKHKNRPSKRKRSISYDTSPMKKNPKILLNNPLAKEQDINFVGKAAPFMDEKNLTCKPCNRIYPTFAKLLWHMSGHFSWFRFQCSRCSFISFSKSDCSNHAKATHSIESDDLQSVVLPIPNWKIALMAHEFSQFNEENDLTGKHTDEVIVDCDEEKAGITDEKQNQQSDSNSDDEDIKIIKTLFNDPETNDFSESCFPMPIVDSNFQIKNELADIDEERRDEIIDIVDDTNDSFLLEDIPQEIYSPDNFEVVPEAIDVLENTQFSVSSHDTDDDFFNKYFIPRSKNIEIVFMDEIKEEAPDSFVEDKISLSKFSPFEHGIEKVENETKIDLNGIEDEPDNCNYVNSGHSEDHSPKKLHTLSHPVPFVNTRPTRNRTRSIKTRNDDFFYEYNANFKSNEIPNSQRVKKTLSPKNANIS